MNRLLTFGSRQTFLFVVFPATYAVEKADIIVAANGAIEATIHLNLSMSVLTASTHWYPYHHQPKGSARWSRF